MQKFLINTVFLILYRGIKAAYKLDSACRSELDSMGDEYTIKLGVLNSKIGIVFGLEGGKFTRYKGKALKDKHIDIIIQFKSLKSALMVALGQTGVAKAFASHRFTLEGDIMQAMPLVRVIDSVECYLFPKFITKHIISTPPKRETNKVRFYLKTLLGI